ncbi:MAG TPA: DNA primase [Tepidisphaeraceae bacterium]
MSGQTSSVDAKTLVLAATDIVELIGQSVALKRRGKDFVGLCPFHQEKSPSFHVSPGKQFFHCYGCKEGGNAIDFVIKRDRVEFIDALKTLAARANIDLPKFGVSKEKASERQQLLEANSAACAFFEKLLLHPEQGSAAREYLKSRGFNAESIKRFQIGCAPPGWDNLLKAVGKKFPPPLLARAGLAKEKINDRGDVVSHYDTFRNRLMFPIRDEASRIIAFGGRVMPGSDDPAKYLNSPETPLFSKSRSIFGLDLARQRIVETRIVAVVEGYTDVVMAHQYGVQNVVSVLGTALTEQHVGILRRFADRIVLLFDPDVAGDTAVDRAVGLFLTQPIEISIASLPDDLDPDEFVMKNGAEAFEEVLSKASDALTFKWKQVDRQFRAADGVTGQQKALDAYLNVIASAAQERAIDNLRWGPIVKRLERLTGLGARDLEKRIRPGAARKPQQQAQRVEVSAKPRPRGLPTAQEHAEVGLLGSLLIEPSRWHVIQQVVGPQDFTDPLRQKLATQYWQVQQDEGEPVFNQFLGELQEPGLTELAIELVETVESLPDLQTTVDSALAFFEEEKRRKELQKQMSQLRRTDAQRGEQDEIALLKGLQEQLKRPDMRRTGS